MVSLQYLTNTYFRINQHYLAMIRVDEARATSQHESSYRPEIDGLRAVAVIAVFINHLQHRWLPGGFLGVDLFFAISGYVVTASLARRRETDGWQMLGGFYTRRFRRLLPALLVMVVVTAILFSLVVSSADDLYTLSMRTGAASLIGLSNIWLLKQGSNYFDFGTQFNPFLHTWSLGVEEQYYLFWPLLVMVCGVGFQGSQRSSLMRLLMLTIALSAASLLLSLTVWRGPAEDASFYLMPARFWELAAGAIVFLLQALWPSRHGAWKSSVISSMACWLFFSLVLIGFTLAEDTAGQFKPVFIIATAGLLISLRQHHLLGRCLSHPASLAIGIASYSLYLWHWPLIVLARWTIGINMLTAITLIFLTALITLGSYRLETTFRFGDVSEKWWRQPLFLYPIITLFSGLFVFTLPRTLAAKLFLGKSEQNSQDFTVTRSIPGTSITSYNCFLEPDAPIKASKENNKCQSIWNPSLPTLFVEGDSIAHSLIPMLEMVHQTRQYNISFFARGGCLTPFVKPWPDNRHLMPRYQGCAQHAHIREEAIFAKIKPGDQLVLATTNAYVQNEESQQSYLRAMADLAKKLEKQKAGLILFSPFPNFTARTAIKTPLSLCFHEWFRPQWAIPAECQPSMVDRNSLIAENSLLKRLQQQLKLSHSNIRTFDPFPILCPNGQAKCSTHMNGTMMFFDGLHLTGSGARFIVPQFQSFLKTIEVNTDQMTQKSSNGSK
jgi:peptidoglycan/LPS O-acetylase OafA/YrhL